MARKTKDAVEIMNRHFGNDPQRRARIDQIKQDMEIGGLIYQARTEAGLTQAQLAKKVKTTQSVISKLEDADYDGHSMAILRRVAKVLGKTVVVSFAQAKPREVA